MIAIVRRNRHGKVISMQYGGSTGGSNTAALASNCGDTVAVARESDRNGVVAAYIAEGPAALRGLLIAVHSERSNIVTLIGGDDIVLAAAAQYLAGTIRTNAAAFARRGHDAIAVALESGRKGMVGQYLMEEIHSSCIILIV